jgi:hypothetical protein
LAKASAITTNQEDLATVAAISRRHATSGTTTKQKVATKTGSPRRSAITRDYQQIGTASGSRLTSNHRDATALAAHRVAGSDVDRP